MVLREWQQTLTASKKPGITNYSNDGICNAWGNCQAMTDDGVKWNYVGYARVSTDDQNLDLQLNALRQAGVPDSHIFMEHVSGAANKRPQFEKALKNLRRGDVFVVWKLDRLSRSMAELVKLANDFKARGVQLKSLTEGIDTTTPMGELFYHIMAALAHFERALISERTKAGIEAAKERGTWKSRPPTIDSNQWNKAVELLQDNPLMSAQQLCDFLPANRKTKKKVKRTTMNNYIAFMREKQPYPFEE